MKEQILKLMSHFGINATVLADEIGVQRSSISHILSERNQPSYDFIIKILKKYPSVSAEWLLLKKGSMLKEETIKNSNKESELFSTTTESKEIIVNPKENINKEKFNDSDKNSLIEENFMVTNVYSINKIVFFFNDNSFEEYKPRKVHS
jgi:plasmid maintenance system antidote protein VapI